MFLVPRLGFGRTALRRFSPRFLLLLFHSLWSSPCRLVLQSAPLYLRRSTLELFLHLRLRSVFPLFPSWNQRVPFLFPAGFLKTGHTYLYGSACGSGPFGPHRGFFRSHLPCVGCHWQDHSASHARGRETSVGSRSNSGSVCSPCDSQGSGVPPSRWFPLVSSQVDVSASDHVLVHPRPASIVDPRARSVPGTDPTGQFFVDPPVLVREVHTSVASSRTTVFPFPTGVFYSVPPGFAGFSLPGMAPPSRQPVSTLRRAVGFWCLLLLVPVFRNPWALVFLLVLFRLSRLRRLLRRSVTGRTFLMGSLRRLRFLCLLLLSWRSLVVSYLVSLRLRFLPTQIGFVLSRRRLCSYGALCAWSVSFSCRRFHASFGSSAESSTFLFFVSLCLGRGFSSL